jgi:hypothetical protein
VVGEDANHGHPFVNRLPFAIDRLPFAVHRYPFTVKRKKVFRSAEHLFV